MPFGLKNVGATYQQAMVTLFHDMMHKEIEVYVDDMIAKSCTTKDHLVDLRKLFKRLIKYKLRVNPNKCIFGASLGKFLGFIVRQRGIKVDPAKVQAIRDMSTLQSKKQIRSFLVWALHKLWQYMLCYTTQLISCMDPIKYNFEKPALIGKISRWQMLLSEFNIVFVTRKAIKG